MFTTYNGDPIRIVLADDHTVVREAIKSLLEKVDGFDIVGQASSGEDVLKLVRKLKPDIVLMDIKMPGIGGLEATRKLKLLSPNTKVVVLTSCEDEIFPRRLLKAGASGYLTKSSGIAEIVKALSAVQSGKRYIMPDVASKLAISHVTGQTDTPFDALSARELQVCLMIIRGDRVQDIADRLHLSPKTVNSYRYRIFDKFNLANDVALTRLAMQYGLIERSTLEQQLFEDTVNSVSSDEE